MAERRQENRYVMRWFGKIDIRWALLSLITLMEDI
jgi:hypothetical protein